MAVPYLACMVLVAAYNNLPPRVLPAIQAVEGGRVGLTHPNSDGSEDLGVMQVNSRWIAPIARAIGVPEPVVRERLIDDACYNIAAAGVILATYLAEERGDLMRAIGDYHSHTPGLNQDYQEQVMAAARAMFEHSSPARPGG
jgi:soluble lytic murein transglycosylase-like protein